MPNIHTVTMTYIHLFLLTAVSAAAPTLTGEDMILTLDPVGGRATSLIAHTIDWQPAGGLELHLVEQYTKKSSDFGQATYLSRTLTPTAGRTELALEATGKQGDYGFCTLRKTFAVAAGEKSVHWRNEFTVGSGAVVPQTQAFLFVQSAPGDAELLVPTEERGCVTWRAGDEPLVAPVARGWVAVRKGKRGLVYVLPFEDVKYVGARAESGQIKLVWRTVAQRVDVEETRTWDVTLLAYDGLDTVHGASDLGCGEVRAGELRLYAARAGEATIRVGEATDKQSVMLTAGLNTIRLDKPLNGAGPHHLTVTQNDRTVELFASFGPTVVKLPMQGERLAEAPARIGGRDIDYRDFAPTPHVPWARPLAGGKLSVFATWGELSANRMVNEIMQRLDADVDTVTIASGLDIGWGLGGPLYGKRSADDIAAALRQCLGGERKYDVMVIGGGINYRDAIGEEVGAMILRRVRDGAGLVYGNMTALSGAFAEALPVKRAFGFGAERYTLKGPTDHPITAALPIEHLSSGITKYVGVKDGAQLLAIAGVDTSGGNPTENPLLVTGTYGKGRVVVLAGLPEGELGQALLARAMLWAAGREPTVRLTALKLDQPSYRYVRQGQPPRLTMECAGDTTGVEAQVSIGDWSTTVWPTQAVELSGHLPVGDTRVDVRLMRGGKVESFGSAMVRVEPVTDLAVKVDEAKDARLGRPIYAHAQPIRGAVHGSAGAYGLTVELIDGQGRVLDRVTPAADGTFSLSTEHSRRYEARVVASLRDNERLVQSAWLPVYLGLSESAVAWDEAQMLLYGQGKGERARVLREAIDPWASALGGDLRATCAVGVPCGIAHVDTGAWESLLSRYAATQDPQLLQRVPCINSPQFAEMVRVIAADRAAPFARLRTLAYINGDEQSYTSYTSEFDFCFSPWCLAEFRAYLKQRYGDIAALNQVWSSQYAGFDEATPPLTERVRQDRSLLPAWNDFRTFNNITFARNYRMIRDELRRHDPAARLGISGTQRPAAFGGYDYTRLMPVMDMLQEYGFCDEMQLAFNPATRLAPAQGYSATYPEGKSEAWRALAYGAAGVSYYNETSGVHPTLRLAPGLRGAAEAIAAARDAGVSMALLTAGKRYDPLAFYYSHESINAGFILFSDNNPYGKAIKWYRHLAATASVSPGWLSRAQLLTGTYGQRAIVLLNIYALGQDEERALQRFMDAGGVVIADENLGRTDEHLRPRQPTTLRGHANFIAFESITDADALLRDRLKIRPQSDVTAGDAPLANAVNTFADGPVRYTTVHNDAAAPRRLTLANPEGASVYDARAGKLLGHEPRVAFDVPAYEAAVLARLPYEVTGLDVEISSPVQPGQSLAIRAAVEAKGPPANHVIALRVTGPDGVTLVGDAWRVRAVGGRCQTAFFVPFNAAAGAWTIDARDAASGAAQRVTFHVR